LRSLELLALLSPFNFLSKEDLYTGESGLRLRESVRQKEKRGEKREREREGE
jgi:hypothetical protein